MAEAQNKFRLLVLTQAPDPRDVGEARSTHRWLSMLSEHAELTVLTQRKRGRPRVQDDLPNARVIEWEEPALLGRFERFNALAKPGWLWYHRRAKKWLKRELKNGATWDLAHMISPLALRYPCPAAGLVAPLVVGPLGGSVPTPEGFASEFGADSWYVRLRRFDSALLRRFGLLRRTYRSADCVICVAPYVLETLRTAGIEPKRFEIESETGSGELVDAYQRRMPPAGELRLLLVGRLVRTKGVRDAVRAMTLLGDLPGVTLDIVGDGSDRAACEAEARAAGLLDSGRVTFHGRVTRERVDEFYRVADVFFFPSLREPSGNVVLESMGHGLPMIVADAGGPGHVVRDEMGLRVRPTTPEGYAADLAAAVRSLAGQPERLVDMGKACRTEAVTRHSWSTKIDRLLAIYRTLRHV